MSNTLVRPLRIKALASVYIQAFITLGACLLTWLVVDQHAAESVFFGGMIALLPNLVFTLYAFRYSGARQTQRVYASLKRGVGLKYLLTVLLFGLVFKTKSVLLLPLFLAYIAVMLANWLGPIFLTNFWGKIWLKK